LDAAGEAAAMIRKRFRLSMLLIVAALTTAAATCEFGRRLVANGWDLVDIPLILLFLILFTWISIAFWTATFGLAIVIAQRRRAAIRLLPTRDETKRTEVPQTALVMPIYNEDPCQVFAGLRATAESIQQVGESHSFDVFILSDTTNPDIWAREEAAWARMRATAVEGGCRVFYRRRPMNRERKAGNIRDFCERWGHAYRYMVILDADSIMTGETLVEMVRRMEDDPKIGILQASPTLVNRDSLLARILQFSHALYGNIFRAGFILWAGTEGNYWGHNAIIRVQAFTEACGLPKLRGKPRHRRYRRQLRRMPHESHRLC
jgi:membrane glycosyltransferase